MPEPPDDTPRPASGDPDPLVPAPEASDRSLRQRIADRWNGLGTAGKAGVVAGSVAVVLGGGFLAVASRRENEADQEDRAGLADVIASLISSAPTEQDSTGDRVAPQYVMGSWESRDYLRKQCLNPRLHPDRCRHEERPVAGSTRKRREDLLTADS